MTTFYKNIRAFLKPFVKIMFRAKCVGLENIPSDGPLLLCCNHTSMFDIPLLIVLCPRQIFFMGKAELFKKPILGKIFRKMGGFPVNRGARDISAIRNACAVAKNGDILGIFPEGRRYLSGPMREVKSGVSFIAAKTGADLLPVSIYKEGNPHIFRRLTIRFGEVMKNEELCSGGASKENLNEISQKIYNSINDMWELKF